MGAILGNPRTATHFRLGTRLAGYALKGEAAMTQPIVWTLLIGLVGLIWVMVLDILGDDHHPHDNRNGNPSPEPHVGDKPQERSSRQSKVAV